MFGNGPGRVQALQPRVVISQFDPPSWVDAVVRNALQLTERRTSLILHLNSLTHYEPSTIRQWNSLPRVRVARRRVPVQCGSGSIILAHALSALEAADLWPSCQYFLLQAANMLWIKPGMELQVFRLTCSVSEYVFREQPNKFLDKGLRHPFTKAMLAGANRSVQVWHYHEGSFYPLQSVARIARHMLRWFANAKSGDACLNVRDCHSPRVQLLPNMSAISDNGRPVLWEPEDLPALVEIIRSVWFVEEFWLPAYAINYDGLQPHDEPSQVILMKKRAQTLSLPKR